MAVIRIGANGNDAHVKRADSATGYQELTTEKFVLLDTNGQQVTDVLTYDAAWGGLQFSRAFDGWLLIENENQIEIETINVGIYHGSTNADGFSMLVDNLFIPNAYDNKTVIKALNAINTPKDMELLEDFEKGSAGFTSFLVDSNASWILDNLAPLSGGPL